MSDTLTRRLAKFAIATDASEIPAEALSHAQVAVADTIAVTIAGSQEQSARIAQLWTAEMQAAGTCRVLGTTINTSPYDAAFVNGLAAHALDFDDTHPHFSHPSATLVSALLPVAETMAASGKDLLNAYIFGLETGCKLGRAIGHGHYMRGWHVSATVGIFGATAALSRLQGLSVDQLTTAWGIAASMTSGLIRNFGTMTKSFHLGHAASSAVKAVWLARNGFSADQDIFERAGGFLQAYGQDDGEPLAELIETLSSPWEILTPGLYTKGWPCCYCNHRPVGGLLKLMAEHNFSAADVKEIKVGFLPGADQPLLKENPQTGLEGKFSVEYAAAAALVDGFLDLNSFTDTAVQRPSVRTVMKRVSRFRIPSDKSFSGVAALIELAIKTDKTTYELRVEPMPGSSEWPLSEKQKESKFKSCVTQALSNKATNRLFDLAMNLSATADVRSLSDATVPL